MEHAMPIDRRYGMREAKGRGRRSTRWRRERDRAGGAAADFGARAGDLDIGQALPVLEEISRPRRQHVARLAERQGEAAVVEVAEIVDALVARAVDGIERPLAAIAGLGAVQGLGAAVG